MKLGKMFIDIRKNLSFIVMHFSLMTSLYKEMMSQSTKDNSFVSFINIGIYIKDFYYITSYEDLTRKSYFFKELVFANNLEVGLVMNVKIGLNFSNL